MAASRKGNTEKIHDLLFQALETEIAVSYTHLTLPTKRIV